MYKKTPRLITSQSIQLMNFKFYYEESLLRQCFFRQQRNNNQYGYTNTGKTELFMEIKKTSRLITSREVLIINLKSYYKKSFPRCHLTTASTITTRTAPLTHARTICSSNLDSLLSFIISVYSFSWISEERFLSALSFIVSFITDFLSFA